MADKEHSWSGFSERKALATCTTKTNLQKQNDRKVTSEKFQTARIVARPYFWGISWDWKVRMRRILVVEVNQLENTRILSPLRHILKFCTMFTGIYLAIATSLQKNKQTKRPFRSLILATSLLYAKGTFGFHRRP